MDIHRCRFVSYPPAAINALAFSHASSLTSTSSDFPFLRLAVGRANGDLEIWNPLKSAWHQESVIHGGKDRSIEGLAWTQDPDEVDKYGVKISGQLRLFSIGCSTAVTEWDLALGRARRHSSGNHGEVWCIAAQPKPSSHRGNLSAGRTVGDEESDFQSQSIVVGCADGAIVLLSTAEGDLQFLKTLARPSKRKARVLSITFKNRDIVIAGHADSTIRVFDTRNGRQIQNITLGPGPRDGPKEILVWSVRSLPNGWIISGDSTGTVRFWDGKHYSLVQRIQGHMADILDVVASADGETIISGGMDRRTTVYRRMGTGNTGERRRWAEIAHRRLHQHDVKAMATFETGNFSVLASGGLDTSPIITPIREFGRENHLSLSNLPHVPPVAGAPKERLMMSWWDSEIRIWRFAHRQPEHDATASTATSDSIHPHRLVARVLTQGDEALTCADLTSDGSLLVACTISGIKVFRLRRKAGDGLKVSKVEVPQSIAETGAKMAKFSPDGKWVVLVRPNNDIQIYGIVRDPLVFGPIAMHLKRLSRDRHKIRIQCGSLGRYKRSVSHIAFSANSRILVTGDLCGYLDSWVLAGHDNSTLDIAEADDASSSSESSDDGTSEVKDLAGSIAGERWIRNPSASLIPQLPTAPLILTFRPLSQRIVSRTPNGNTTIYSARQTGFPHSHHVSLAEDRLFVLTCDHQMYEFRISSGTISDWSRRNPTASLPSKFRKILERAKGSVWDVNQARERIWIYGSSWLWMFDLSKNFPVDVEAGNDTTQNEATTQGHGRRGVKRKRGTLDTQEIPGAENLHTGAGGRAPDSELTIGIGRKFRKANGPEVSQGRWISADGDLTTGLTRDDEQANHDSSLVSLRRDSRQRVPMDRNPIEDRQPVDDETGNDTQDMQIAPSRTHTNLPYWGTHKYRGILGIVRLGDGDENGETGGGSISSADDLPRGVEVALVERPLWDVDLPPKYHGNQEWDR